MSLIHWLRFVLCLPVSVGLLYNDNKCELLVHKKLSRKRKQKKSKWQISAWSSYNILHLICEMSSSVQNEACSCSAVHLFIHYQIYFVVVRASGDEHGVYCLLHLFMRSVVGTKINRTALTSDWENDVYYFDSAAASGIHFHIARPLLRRCEKSTSVWRRLNKLFSRFLITSTSFKPYKNMIEYGSRVAFWPPTFNSFLAGRMVGRCSVITNVIGNVQNAYFSFYIYW